MSKSFSHRISGLVAPTLTPFTENDQIDTKTLEIYIDWLIKQTVHGLFPMGGSGEWPYLTLPERKIIIDCVIQTANKRIPVFPNVGCFLIKDTLDLAAYAQEAGADAITVVIPDTIEPTQEAIFNYFKLIDDIINIPVFIYDPKGEGPLSPTPDTMKRMLDELKHISAMKYRTLNGEKMGYMLKSVGERMSILSGSETVYLPDLVQGVVGVVGGGVNLYPEDIWSINTAFQAGDMQQARQNQFQVLEHIKMLSIISWPCSGKIALRTRKLPFNVITRHPTAPYSQTDYLKLQCYFCKKYFGPFGQ
jgi:4-hydroxy-tetrahydrodipicolinate synthase